MKDDSSSRTAEFMAFFRAFEHARAPGRRFFADPYAESMLTGALRAPAALGHVPVARDVIGWFVDRAWPGTRSSAVARTRAIDDLAVAAVANGAQQFLILGAGFDTRAFRLAELEHTATFEVDHPATQAAKARRLELALRGLLRRPTFVAVDFERDDLERALARAGFDPAKRTIALWESVVSYLTAPAVDRTMAVLSKVLSPQSRLVFSYVHRGAVDGSANFAGAARWRSVVRNSGEPFVFGFDPKELAAYLAPYGFLLAEDFSTDVAAARYNAARGRRERGSKFNHVAVADRAAG